MQTSPRLAEAFAFAERIHRGQTRKKTLAPTLSHLMAVTALVLENGGDEDEGVAALLHDGPEDCAGQATLDEIRRCFGDRVAEIVEGCTDTMESPRPPWLERKQAYFAKLAEAGPATQLVSLADKVHNVRSLLVEHRQVGEALWERFSATREQTLWYYQSLLELFQKSALDRCAALIGELALALAELEERVAQGRS